MSWSRYPRSSLKEICLIIFMLLLQSQSSSTLAMDSRKWDAFKQRYVTQQGRVVDTANGNISHSESQGVAMLFAAFFGDKATFDRIWYWTRARLQVRDDHLFAWKWDPQSAPHVSDENNASDGDILIAWALYLAFERWGETSYRGAADYIVADIRHKLIEPSAYGPVLLPGTAGFKDAQGLTLNLSYWVFPAFDLFAKYGQAPQWHALSETGEHLLRAARYGRWHLPPDWLRMEGETLAVVADRYPPRFGYNAVRIPLYLCWAGRDSKTLLRPFALFWRDSYKNGQGIPAWVNLRSDQPGSYDAPLGFYAIANLVNRCLGSSRYIEPPQSARWGEHYYSASLSLMAELAR